MKAIHIVSFDVPFPANYGGVIDVYYKLWWLKRAGISIHLHCFAYGRKPAPELEALCEKVTYYERKTGLLSNLSLLPYTVKSRQSKALEKNLLADDLPILFEVLHTCYLLNDARFKNRQKIYRHSNIEHQYYLELARSERSLVKRLFLRVEAWKLRRFEAILNFADIILAVNQKDTDYFKQYYPKAISVYLPSFHPNASVTSKTGKGDYLLFHGNLSISENYEAALWLTEHVFSRSAHNVILAGLNPPEFLKAAVQKYPNIQLLASPSEQEMDALIQNAQAHVLYTPQPTGLKLKLLNTLFKGRFVISNSHMISGTGVSANNGFLIANSGKEYIKAINEAMNRDFSAELVAERTSLTAHFDNTKNAGKLIEVVFGRQ